MKYLLIFTIIFFSNLYAESLKNKYLSGLNEFINTVKEKSQYDEEYIKEVSRYMIFEPKVIKLINSPAEKKSYSFYQRLFISDKRIKDGKNFLKVHKKILNKVEKKYGIPSEIIVSIIGIETSYGQNFGSFNAIQSLSTLAFSYEKRKKFFLKELNSILELIRSQNLDIRKIEGSYAGALGMPQFMPSSYIHYAVDFDNDGKIDLWNSIPDIVASVANYLKSHGWNYNEPARSFVNYPSQFVSNKFDKHNDRKFIKVDINKIQNKFNLRKGLETKRDYMVLLDKPTKKYYIGHNNFYVITRYNRSVLYADAVLDLSEKINEKK